jgi:GR25 family glycosyltransferase involved in LPS biosynthesis
MAENDFDMFFPHRVCINLDRRPDRWTRVRGRFRQAGVSGVARFAAVDGSTVEVPEGWPYPRGAYGCLQSHVKAVEHARTNNWPNILIFEDDVVFADNFISSLEVCIQALPEDWEMFFLGCSHEGDTVPLDNGLHRLTRSYSTFAYALNASIYDAFIAENQKVLQPVDLNNLTLQQRHLCLAPLPNLVWVESDFSDAQGLPLNPWWIEHSLIMGGRSMSDILAQTRFLLPLRGEPENWRHARRILDHFHANLPSASFGLILPRGVSPPSDWPEGPVEVCHCEKPYSRADYLEEGFGRWREQATYFALWNPRLYLSGWYTRAGLAMCSRYGIVGAFSGCYEINEADTQQFLEGNIFDIPFSRYDPLHLDLPGCGAYFLHRDHVDRFRWDQVSDSALGISLQKIPSGPKFLAPSQAMLFWGE